jgi:hypothetical protein
VEIAISISMHQIQDGANNGHRPDKCGDDQILEALHLYLTSLMDLVSRDLAATYSIALGSLA